MPRNWTSKLLSMRVMQSTTNPSGKLWPREIAWTMEKIELQKELLNVCQQYLMAPNQVRYQSQSNIHKKMVNLKTKLDRTIKEQEEAKTTIDIQVENKARLVDLGYLLRSSWKVFFCFLFLFLF